MNQYVRRIYQGALSRYIGTGLSTRTWDHISSCCVRDAARDLNQSQNSDSIRIVGKAMKGWLKNDHTV